MDVCKGFLLLVAVAVVLGVWRPFRRHRTKRVWVPKTLVITHVVHGGRSMAMPVNVSAALGTIKVPVARPDIASYRISIEGPDPRTQDFPVDAASLEALFADVADGAYMAKAQSLAADGAVLDELSQAFDVVTPPTEKDAKVPTSINVVVGG